MAMLWTAVGVLIVWGVIALAIRHWGPGQAKRSVVCPQKKRLAWVVVEQREGDFGCLRVTDAVACSFFPGGPLQCKKWCVERF
jgi:hypothetical protein